MLREVALFSQRKPVLLMFLLRLLPQPPVAICRFIFSSEGKNVNSVVEEKNHFSFPTILFTVFAVSSMKRTKLGPDGPSSSKSKASNSPERVSPAFVYTTDGTNGRCLCRSFMNKANGDPFGGGNAALHVGP